MARGYAHIQTRDLRADEHAFARAVEAEPGRLDYIRLRAEADLAAQPLDGAALFTRAMLLALAGRRAAASAAAPQMRPAGLEPAT